MFTDLEAEEPTKETNKVSIYCFLRGQLKKVFQGDENG